MTQTVTKPKYDFSDRTKYDALMEAVRYRVTTRAFDASYVMPHEHYEMILDAARHAPSGANTQPWHFIVITDQNLKNRIMDYFREEQVHRAKLKMKFPTPDYRGLGTAPGFIVVASDFRWVKAFPVLNDGSELDRMYKENAERILLQSVAAATMSAHLAAAALGYNVWWITAIGQEKAQKAMKPLLDIPDELSVLDIMCFGPPFKLPYKRWKKDLSEITNWNKFDRTHFLTEAQIDEWVSTTRHKVMYRDAQNAPGRLSPRDIFILLIHNRGRVSNFIQIWKSAPSQTDKGRFVGFLPPSALPCCCVVDPRLSGHGRGSFFFLLRSPSPGANISREWAR